MKFVLILPVPVLIGISGLSKPTGFFLLLFSIFILIWFSLKKIPPQKILKRVIYLILGTAPFVAYYFWYSYHLDPEIFKVIFSIQSGRPAGFSSFIWFLISPSYDTFVFKDGWYLFPLVYALYLIIKPRKEIKIKYILLAFVFWTLVVMFTGGEGDLLSWYRFPLFPILSIICAIGIINLVKLNNFFSTFIIFGLLLGSRYLLVNAFHHNIQALDYRRWMFICLAPSLLYWLFKVKILKSLNKFIAISIIIVGLFLNTVLIYNYFDLICEAKTCSMVPTTKLSVIRFPFIWRFFTLDHFK